MPLDSIKINNFSRFQDTTILFARHINVFIGENGTCKTHLLKLLYAFFEAEGEPYQYKQRGDEIELVFKSKEIFFLSFLSNLKLIFKSLPITLSNNEASDIEFNINKKSYYWNMSKKDGEEMGDFSLNTNGKKRDKSVFIPAKEMLSHSDGLLEMTKKYSENIPFDKTLLDIIEKAKQWKLKEIPEIAKGVKIKLENIIHGEIVYENNRFYINKSDGKRVDFDLESEGLKKIGLIWQLLMNENITSNSMLLWDEPESNINPKLIPDIVEILLILARHGVQVFLATHDYFLAKYIEVLSSVLDSISFHSLYYDGDLLKCETSDKFTSLFHNDIMSESIRLYETEVQKVMNQ